MNELRQALLEGEIELLKEEIAKANEMIAFFAAEQDFWRRKYLLEHPELDNWEYVETAREDEHENE